MNVNEDQKASLLYSPSIKVIYGFEITDICELATSTVVRNEWLNCTHAFSYRCLTKRLGVGVGFAPIYMWCLKNNMVAITFARTSGNMEL